MNRVLRNIIRTALLYVPLSQEAKPILQRTLLKALHLPFARDFEALRSLPGKDNALYLDIGANQGFAIDTILLYKPKCRVLSFEPNPILAAKLKSHYAGDARVELFPYGLGAEEGEFPLHIPVYAGFVFSGLASFDAASARAWLAGDRVMGFDPARLEIREVSCRVKRLDSFGLDPSFMKITVQGFEQQVLEGARETVARCRPIILISSATETNMQFLSRFGYQRYRYDRGNKVLCPSNGGLQWLYFIPAEERPLLGGAEGGSLTEK